MPYNNVISRTEASAFIPEDVAADVIESAVEQSAALSLFPQVRMSRAQQRLPVLSVLPIAYFVNGDTGLKQTTEQNWTNMYLNVEELAAIVPIPEAVIDDADFDVWGEIKPRLVEAIGRALDNAVFFGVNKPAAWPSNVVAAAIAAGNTATVGSTAAQGGFANDIANAMATVEADGFDVNGYVAPRTLRASLRGARDTTGQSLLDVSLDEIEGQRVVYSMPGLWPTGAGATRLIMGDFTKGILGVRQDISYKVLDQAVITDAGGLIVYNLPQQDMLALRVTFRCAFAVANPLTYDQPTEASRYPFAVLRNA